MFRRQHIGRAVRQTSQAAWRTAGAAQRRQAFASEASSSGTGSPNTGRSRRGGLSLTLVALGGAALGAAGTYQAFSTLGMGFYSDQESLQRFTPGDDEAKKVEDTINSLPLVAELRARPDMQESRPHMKMPQEYRGRSLTGSALLGPGKMVVPPYVWLEDDGKSMVAIAYVGENLCGHPSIIHGGLLATMLDEGLARCSFRALPHNISVTANLNIDYRKPAPAGSYLVLRAWLTKVEGRKAWVKGHIELLAKPGEKPTILAEASALYISPKFAAMMPRIP